MRAPPSGKPACWQRGVHAPGVLLLKHWNFQQTAGALLSPGESPATPNLGRVAPQGQRSVTDPVLKALGISTALCGTLCADSLQISSCCTIPWLKAPGPLSLPARLSCCRQVCCSLKRFDLTHEMADIYFGLWLKPAEPSSRLDSTLRARASLALSFCSLALSASLPLGFCNLSSSAVRPAMAVCMRRGKLRSIFKHVIFTEKIKLLELENTVKAYIVCVEAHSRV